MQLQVQIAARTQNVKAVNGSIYNIQAKMYKHEWCNDISHMHIRTKISLEFEKFPGSISQLKVQHPVQ